MDGGERVPDRRDDACVVVPGERGMDPSLEAHLRGPALPRLGGAPDDLLVRDEECRAAEVLRELPLRERAEAAPEVADVRVLDVPGDDVGDLVAADLSTQTVGGGEHLLALPTTAGEKPGELVLPELVTHEPDRRRIAAEEEGRNDRLAGRPSILACQPHRVGGPADRRSDGRVGPDVERSDVLRVERQPRGELEPSTAACVAEQRERGPRRLGVDVVDRDGRDAAPVVDPRVEQTRKVVVGEVRRGLDVDVRSEDDPRDRDRPEVVVHGRVRMPGHPRPGLRAEVLDDDLPQVPVLLAERPEGEQRVDPLLARLADPDQEPAREGDRELAREPDRLEASCRRLVRRGPVRLPFREQPVGGRLEHDPHRGGDGAQQLEIGTGHHAGVEVRQEACLLQHPAGAPRQVLERRLASERRELLARHLVAQLGLVPEREERLGAARTGSLVGDREHLVLGQERALPAPRWPRERAVAAHVAAERRQWDEDLRRVRDQRAASKAARLGHEVVEGRREDVGDQIAHRVTCCAVARSGLLAPVASAYARRRPGGCSAASSYRPAAASSRARRIVSSASPVSSSGPRGSAASASS